MTNEKHFNEFRDKHTNFPKEVHHKKAPVMWPYYLAPLFKGMAIVVLCVAIVVGLVISIVEGLNYLAGV